ncbi:MAG: hypothetical protein NC489_40690 [Ruminococcus flavefaciens]|nr:hypothetical protein [Ruminococcus flavefaciens]
MKEKKRLNRGTGGGRMVKVTNDCCGCAAFAYPCSGENCSLRHVKHYYCDNCGEEADKLYYGAFGRELCAECILKELEVVE